MVTAPVVTAAVRIGIKRLDPAVPLPSYAHPGDAGADLHSAEEFTLQPGERKLVKTGLAMEIPDGYVGLVHPRSGLAARHGVTGVNSPGTIDSGYRGEVKLNLINLDPDHAVSFAVGDRLAQLVVQPVVRAEFTEVDQLSDTPRGHGGHGSTGGHDSLG
ncbi:dUTP diphosphatase [Natronoglycomyces albus]|uniref:Deoxyuridine 5'-triphosphate nucleotidohydrolase n=1 Tax=Natronoglycomyces albus TaxID=2811108 RepID=A0A895XU20_9ACTN|nr:dUTP diphosphatase [Natronoglycomyces albus]